MFLNNVCHFAGAWDLTLDVCELAQFLFGLLHFRTALDTGGAARVAQLMCGRGFSDWNWGE